MLPPPPPPPPPPPAPLHAPRQAGWKSIPPSIDIISLDGCERPTIFTILAAV